MGDAMTRRANIPWLVVLLTLAAAARGEAQVLPSDPADSGRLGRRAPGDLGPSPGENGGTFGQTPGDSAGVIISRPGRAGPRLPADITRPGQALQTPGSIGIATPEAMPINRPPLYGPMELPEGPDDLGPADGLTLDQAIERLVHQNPDLRTQFFEIPQAEADILTAGLRANPLLYADSNAVPYGNFSKARPGGQTQYDVGVTWPFDVTHKRQARTLVAVRARRVLDAQYQDAVRIQVDNLDTAYVNVLSARETVRFYRASLKGLSDLLKRLDELYRAGQKTEADVNIVRIQLTSAKLGYNDAFGTYRSAKRRLATLLGIPQEEVDGLNLRGTIRVLDALPPPDDQLLNIAMQSRPDLAAYRLGVVRAEADVALARANRLSDVYVSYFPYVFQNNAPFGQKSAHSWSVSATLPLPVFNRNQGNIARAKLNVTQTASGLQSLEKKVAEGVLLADQEYDVTRAAVEQIERDLIPAAKQVRDTEFRRYFGGEVNILAYLEAQRSYNETIRQYRDMVTRHRRSMLDLNTALGVRVLP
ncbi:MAG: TolC family protein [Isosphaeraceae bacterium]